MIPMFSPLEVGLVGSFLWLLHFLWSETAASICRSSFSHKNGLIFSFILITFSHSSLSGTAWMWRFNPRMLLLCAPLLVSAYMNFQVISCIHFAAISEFAASMFGLLESICSFKIASVGERLDELETWVPEIFVWNPFWRPAKLTPLS